MYSEQVADNATGRDSRDALAKMREPWRTRPGLTAPVVESVYTADFQSAASQACGFESHLAYIYLAAL
jgi:hypothetical protein